jgi:hypothetical protein
MLLHGVAQQGGEWGVSGGVSGGGGGGQSAGALPRGGGRYIRLLLALLCLGRDRVYSQRLDTERRWEYMHNWQEG